MAITSQIWSKNALINGQWLSRVLVEIDNQGRIIRVKADADAQGHQTAILLPAMSNLHSHAFQRAMAGMTETRGPDANDSFWSWRTLMYRFLQHLSPDDIESICAFAQVEMLEAGFCTVGEFHYLHRQANGQCYNNPAEMCERIISAAAQTGIGLTLLPVLYEQGGVDGRELVGGQLRFGNSIDQFHTLYLNASSSIDAQAGNMNIGIAPHSLRAVTTDSLIEATAMASGKPFHIHVAEQQAEVDEIVAAWGARPVEWLLDNHQVNSDWCFIHATQMTTAETQKLAKSGAVTGLCPITESNLGDGIFNGKAYNQYHGHWGIGTDSNIRISLSEELRTFEYSQRLKERRRGVFASTESSTGRSLFDRALHGGARALQHATGHISVGNNADLIALDGDSAALAAVDKDGWLDAWLFAAGNSLVCDVWAAGRHLVKEGSHVDRLSIERNYKRTVKALLERL